MAVCCAANRQRLRVVSACPPSPGGRGRWRPEQSAIRSVTGVELRSQVRGPGTRERDTTRDTKCQENVWCFHAKATHGIWSQGSGTGRYINNLNMCTRVSSTYLCKRHHLVDPKADAYLLASKDGTSNTPEIDAQIDNRQNKRQITLLEHLIPIIGQCPW